MLQIIPKFYPEIVSAYAKYNKTKNTGGTTMG